MKRWRGPAIAGPVVAGMAALAGACATLPDTYPVAGTVAGVHLETKVDSQAAVYFMGHYLAGDRRNPDLDRRIDALYRGAAPDRLPGRAELKRIADAFSTDFAAIYFADRLGRDPANRRLRQAYERQMKRVKGALARSNALSLPSLAKDYDVIFAPGFLYREYPETGADLAAPRSALSDAGFSTSWIETDEAGSIRKNADLIASYLRDRARSGRKIILISASKGGPEIAYTLSRLPPAQASLVKAWINIVGTMQGTVLVDELLEAGPSLHYAFLSDLSGLQSMTTKASRARFAQFALSKDMLVINYFGVPVTGSVSQLARRSYSMLRPHGPNDGMILLPDLIAPNGITLVAFGRDHYLLGGSVRDRTVALVTTVIHWLESCSKDAAMSWHATVAGARCDGVPGGQKAQTVPSRP